MKKHYLSAGVSNFLLWGIYLLIFIVERTKPHPDTQFVTIAAAYFVCVPTFFTIVYGAVFYKLTQKILAFVIIYFCFSLCASSISAFISASHTNIKVLGVITAEALPWSAITSGLVAIPGLGGKLINFFQTRN